MVDSVCPFWMGYLLSSPIRKLWHNPEKILAPYIRQGMRVLDVGCAMGFFSMPMARMVGKNGKVICVDIQARMIQSLKKRAKSAGLAERIETYVCSDDSFSLKNFEKEIDFALAFAVVHEIQNPSILFSELYQVLKPEGKLLMAEPKGVVTEKDFTGSVHTARGQGFVDIGELHISGARAVLLQKQQQ